MELCKIILDTGAQKPVYERFFGLLGQRLCSLNKKYIECFEKLFQDRFEIVHRLENVKLKNIAKFFAHLLVTDAISWGVCIYSFIRNQINNLFFLRSFAVFE